MGVVRISDELHDSIKKWITQNGNKYTHSTASAFVNKAVFEKLQKISSKG